MTKVQSVNDRQQRYMAAGKCASCGKRKLSRRSKRYCDPCLAKRRKYDVARGNRGHDRVDLSHLSEAERQRRAITRMLRPAARESATEYSEGNLLRATLMVGRVQCGGGYRKMVK